LAVFLNGDGLLERDADGRMLRDDSFLLMFNAHDEPLPFTTPPSAFGSAWRLALDTDQGDGAGDTREWHAGETLEVAARSHRVLTRSSGSAGDPRREAAV
jgi:glycogen operon protein